MAVREIVLYAQNSAALRKKSRLVRRMSQDVKRLVQDLKDRLPMSEVSWYVCPCAQVYLVPFHTTDLDFSEAERSRALHSTIAFHDLQRFAV
jgi:hypothetical protein